MVAAGIIAEYNPFHQGHQYHIEETRKKTGADYIVVAMSGDYVQRGEPAVADKYMRSEMALCGGADLVLEIPALYAAASAEYFASAGVKILDGLGCLTYLSFGSEQAEADDYRAYVDILLEEPPAYRRTLQEELKKGHNYAAARSRAVCSCLMERGESWQAAEEFLAGPNHILGLEYMKALRRLGSRLIPVTVKRRGSGYHDARLEGIYPSAAAIRRGLRELVRRPEEMTGDPGHRITELIKALPVRGGMFLRRYLAGDFAEWDDLMSCLDYQFLMRPPGRGSCFGMDEELALRLKKRYRPGMDFQGLTKLLHTRRLTDASLRRALLHMLLQMRQYPFLAEAWQIPVPYVRALGFRREAFPLLKKIQETAALEVIRRPVEGIRKFSKETAAGQLYEIDLRAADLYEQTAARKCGRGPKPELIREQIIL